MVRSIDHHPTRATLTASGHNPTLIYPIAIPIMANNLCVDKTKKLITRAEYLAPMVPGQTDRKREHRAYYAQFVTPAHFARLKNQQGLVDQIKASQEPHFNDIELKLWDRLALCVPAESDRLMRQCGDFPTLCGAVCILKEAAQQIREGSYHL